MRGNSESRTKSVRNRAAWERKRKAARDGKGIITATLPAWIEKKDGKLVLLPERAEVIKRIFRLAASGYGQKLIVQTLERDRVPTFKKCQRKGKTIGDHWSPSYIAWILNDRRTLGEFQPRTKGGKEAGAVITNYYPAVITEEHFYAARAGAEQRKNNPGRTSITFINLFAGLLTDVVTSTSLFATTRVDAGQCKKILMSTAAAQGLARCVSFPVSTFERAVLSRLREIDPKEILGGNGIHDEVARLEGELTALDSRLALLERELASGDVPSIARVLRSLEPSRKELAEKLSIARQKAANPLSASWGETQSLVEVLDSAADPVDVRLRLRSAIRRIVETIQVLIVPRGRDRLAALQIWFAGGKQHRDYLILHRPPKANGKSRTEGGCWCCSLADVHDPAELDLRRPEDAEALAAELLELDLAKLEKSEGT
jgi:hypothetical protein